VGQIAVTNDFHMIQPVLATCGSDLSHPVSQPYLADEGKEKGTIWGSETVASVKVYCL